MERYFTEMTPGGDYIGCFQREDVLFVCFQTAMYIVDRNGTAEVVEDIMTGAPLFDGDYVYFGFNYLSLMKWNWRKKKLVWKINIEENNFFPGDCKIINSWWISSGIIHAIILDGDHQQEILIGTANGKLLGRHPVSSQSLLARVDYIDEFGRHHEIGLFPGGILVKKSDRGCQESLLGRGLGSVIYMEITREGCLCVASVFPRSRYWVNLEEWCLFEVPLFKTPRSFAKLNPRVAVVSRDSILAEKTFCDFIENDSGMNLYFIDLFEGFFGSTGVISIGNPICDIINTEEDIIRVLVRESSGQYSLKTIKIDINDLMEKIYQK